MTTSEIQTLLEKLFTEENSSDIYIIDRIEKQQERFIQFIEKVADDKIKSSAKGKQTVSKSEVKEKVRKLYKIIIDSIKYYLNGEFETCRKNIYRNFITPGNVREIKGLMTTSIKNPSKKVYFRIRSNDTYNIYKKKEMFHIPFEKRGVVGNQRFSVSGYPCLYLGSSIYGCWEETQRPNIDMCNIVALQSTKELKFLSLSIPTIKNDVGIYANLLYSLVLRLVCSLKAHNISDNFKQEYIIPQIVLESIIQRNSQSSKVPIDGIKYTSSIYCQPQDMFKDKSLLTNYVLPIRKSKKEGLCSELSSIFILTEPTSFIVERLKENVKTTYMYFYEESTNIYNSTEFGVMEDKLKNREFLPVE